jgi:hypothetical protein
MKKIYHMLLVLYPILSGYGFSAQLDFGILLLLISGCLYISKRHQEIKFVFFRGYILFFLTATILSFAILKTIPLRLFLFSINLWLATALVDIELLKRYYGYAVAICCSYFILQEITYNLTGSRISGLTTLVPTIYGAISEKYVAIQTRVPRSAAFFLEPSYFAQYLFPYIVINIFSKQKSTFKKAIAVSFIMFLIKSGNGTILLLLVWGIWFVFSSIKTYIKISVATLMLLGLVGIYFIDPTIFESLFSRTSELHATAYLNLGDSETSGFIRFFRGYYLYNDMPLFNKLFGSTSDAVVAAMNASPFLWNRDQFMNGVQTLLIYNGLFVCLLYFRHIFLFFKGTLNQKEVVALVAGFIFLMFSESYYLCSRALLTMLFIYGYIQNNPQSKIRGTFKLNLWRH